MYSKVKSCVSLCNSYSESFSYVVGLRKGDVISTILFSLFQILNCLYKKTFIVVFFADDMVSDVPSCIISGEHLSGTTNVPQASFLI